MKFKLLYYGNDRVSILEGEALMKEILNDNSEIKDSFLKIMRNKEWYEISKKAIDCKKSPFPYPSSIMLKIKSSFNNDIIVDMIPKLCYLGIYVDSKELELFLEKNFKNLILK